MTNPANSTMREAINHSLDALQTLSYHDGFEAALSGLDELSDFSHNQEKEQVAEVLRWAAKELRGENV